MLKKTKIINLAVRQGNLNAVQEIVANDDFDVSLADSKGKAAAHYAASANDSSILRELSESYDLDVNQGTLNNETPLHFASRSKGSDAGRELLAMPGVSLTRKNKDGESAWDLAIKAQNSGMLTEFLKTGKINLSEGDVDGKTLLHHAAINGNLQLVKDLLSNPQVKINQEDNNGFTPLYDAVTNGQKEVVRELVNSPEIDIAAGLKRNPQYFLEYAVEANDAKTVRGLSEIPGVDVNKASKHDQVFVKNTNFPKDLKKKGLVPIQVAAQLRHSDVIRELISSYPSIDVNIGSAGEYGTRALSRAVRNRDIGTVNELSKSPDLLGYHCDVDRFFRLGFDYDQIKFLTQVPGFNVNSFFSNTGETLLSHVLKYGDKETARSLMDHPEIKISTGAFLAAASKLDNFEFFQEILESYNFDINKGTDKGFTPLMQAVSSGNIKAVKELLKQPNINVLAVDKNKSNVFHYFGSNEEIANLLFDSIDLADLDIHQTNGGSYLVSPFIQAYKMGNTTALRKFFENYDVNVYMDFDDGTLLFRGTMFDRSQPPNIKSLQELLKHPDIDVNRVDRDGHTALNKAAYYSNSKGAKVMRELLKHPNLDVNKGNINNSDWTPLHSALMCESYENVEALLEHPDTKIRYEDFEFIDDKIWKTSSQKRENGLKRIQRLLTETERSRSNT